VPDISRLSDKPTELLTIIIELYGEITKKTRTKAYETFSFLFLSIMFFLNFCLFVADVVLSSSCSYTKKWTKRITRAKRWPKPNYESASLKQQKHIQALLVNIES